MKPNVTHLSPDSRRWRTGLLLACGFAIAVLFYTQFLCTPLLPYCGSAGFDAQYDRSSASLEVTGVTRAEPAAKARLRIGDRIFFHEIAFLERRRLDAIRWGNVIPVGERLNFVVHRGVRRFATVLVPYLAPATWKTWSDWVVFAIQLWGLSFAALLASRRPDLVTARLLSLLLLLVFGVAAFTGPLVPWVVRLDFVIYTFGNAIYVPGTLLLFALFAAQFARPLSPNRKLLTALIIALTGLASVVNVVLNIVRYVLALPDNWIWTFEMVVGGTGALLAATCAIAAVVASRGAERQRAIWATVSFGLYFALLAVGFALSYSTNQRLLNSVNEFFFVAQVLMPLGLTYAVLSRRIVDIGYVVNRAAVFTGISIFVLGVFVMVEWALSAWASSARHTTSLIVNIAVALGLGLSLRYIHTYVERLVDRAMFRKRHEDEAALRRFAHESSYITDRSTLLDRAVRTVEEHTDADDAAIFVRDGAPSYVSWPNGQGTVISENDPGIVALRAWGKPLHPHDETDSELSGEVAFPMISRGALVGVLVCGPKRGGEAYAPDESAALMALAHEVGSALDTMSGRNNGAVDALQKTQALIVEKLDAVISKLDGRPPPSASP